MHCILLLEVRDGRCRSTSGSVVALETSDAEQPGRLFNKLFGTKRWVLADAPGRARPKAHSDLVRR